MLGREADPGAVLLSAAFELARDRGTFFAALASPRGMARGADDPRACRRHPSAGWRWFCSRCWPAARQAGGRVSSRAASPCFWRCCSSLDRDAAPQFDGAAIQPVAAHVALLMVLDHAGSVLAPDHVTTVLSEPAGRDPPARPRSISIGALAAVEAHKRGLGGAGRRADGAAYRDDRAGACRRCRQDALLATVSHEVRTLPNGDRHGERGAGGRVIRDLTNVEVIRSWLSSA